MFKKFFYGTLVFALALGGFIPLNSQAEEQLEITPGAANFTSDTTAEIYWTTNNIAAECELNYGVGIARNNGMGTRAEIIQSLTNDGKYHYHVSLSNLTVDNAYYYYSISCASTINNSVAHPLVSNSNNRAHSPLIK